MKLLSGLCLWLCTTVGAAQSFSGQRDSYKAVEDVPLYDTKGQKQNIQLQKKPLTALVLLSPECPLCRNYTLVLNNLQQTFGNNLQLIGIVPGSAYEKGAVADFVAAYKVRFVVFIDPDKKAADYLMVTITPEVILLNEEGSMVYRGAIDNWVEELGKKKIRADNHYLADAIQQYMAGSPVALKITQPKGCYINEF